MLFFNTRFHTSHKAFELVASESRCFFQIASEPCSEADMFMMDMDEEDLVDNTMDSTMDDTMDDTLDQHIHLETEKLLEGKNDRPEVTKQPEPEVTQQPEPEVVAPGRTRGRPRNVVASAPMGLGKRVTRQRK
jgi:hypothetical protein